MGFNLTLLGLLVFRRRFAALEWLLRVSRPWGLWGFTGPSVCLGTGLGFWDRGE